jgi:peptide deformylase
MNRLITPKDAEWKRLFEPADPVTDSATQVFPHLVDMSGVLSVGPGIGLAAPQIGVFLRFFIMGGPQIDLPGTYRVMINPEIIERSTEGTSGEEGCLSFPARKTFVRRADRIVVNYEAIDGRIIGGREFKGLIARVIQHEVDHLNGVCLFPNDKPSTIPATGPAAKP